MSTGLYEEYRSIPTLLEVLLDSFTSGKFQKAKTNDLSRKDSLALSNFCGRKQACDAFTPGPPG